jgi:(S)-2-hydroxyglutarate dehydrogenase
MMQFDFTVAGAGIVGLSTAYKLSLAYPDARILVLEKEDRVAAHQTGHNSGVIHSGIYYKPGSYRARNCVNGRRQLVDFCRKHDVAHDICGKVIVATEPEELPRLDNIYERGLQNGIEGIRMIGREELLEIEPHVNGIRAIHVPCAGIVDFAGVCRVLSRLLHEKGHTVMFHQPVQNVSVSSRQVVVQTPSHRIKSGYFINCTGLHSDRVARAAGIRSNIRIVPFRGEYYELTPDAEHLVKGLIYPLPNPAFPFLGVHFTRMALGGVECGPNAVFAFKREGYSKTSFDLRDTIETADTPGFWKLARKHWRMGLDEIYRSFSKTGFLKNLQKLIPSVQLQHLTGSPSGVRAMALLPNGEIFDDFRFETAERQLHVLNAPSPAATAGLAIGDEIVATMKERFNLG